MERGGNTTGRGIPLALLTLMIVAWVCARAIIWDNPIAYSAPAMAASDDFSGPSPASAQPAAAAAQTVPAPQSLAYAQPYGAGPYPPYAAYGGYPYPPMPMYYGYPPHYAPHAGPGNGSVPAPQIVYYPAYAGAAHPQAYYPPAGAAAYPRAAAQFQRGGFARAPDLTAPYPRFLPQSFSLDDIPPGVGLLDRSARYAGQDPRRTAQASRPPAGAGIATVGQPTTDRWLLDVYGFYRQGSSALNIPQGRAPIYGASQLAANLQWRARPSSSHDPRLYARAYQAQVEGGESEIAAGVSGRPIGKVPVRLFGELRATQNPAVSDLGLGVQTKFRPAAYAATELPPVKLPMGFSLEAYGSAGYVLGSPSTYFLDGQAVATRELLRIGKPGSSGAAVSIGGGIWGGAQRDARRVDIGPTLRFDVDIGKMPARVSVDYREQVAGDAEPDSGVAATVSTRF